MKKTCQSFQQDLVKGLIKSKQKSGSTSSIVVVLIVLVLYVLALPGYSSAQAPTPTTVAAPAVSPGNPPVEDQVKAFNYRAYTYAQANNFEKAISNYSTAIDLAPDTNVDGYYGRGLVYYHINNFERAILDFDKAILIESDYSDAYVDRGLAYRGLRDLDQAVADFNKAIEVDSTNGRAYHSRGLLYYETGFREKAISDFEKYLELEPNPSVEVINRVDRLKSGSRSSGIYLSLAVIAGIISTFWWLKRKNIFSSVYTHVEDTSKQEGSITCDNCRCISSMPEAFQTTTTGRICPRCIEKQLFQSLEKTFKLVSIAIVINTLLAFVLFWLDSSWHYLFANTIITVPFWYVTLVLYALVQAGGGLLGDGRFFLLQIGRGPILFEKIIGTCQINLRKFPDFSFTSVRYPERSSMKLRLVIFYMSSLLFHGAIVLLLWPEFEASNLLSTYAFKEVFFLTNAYMLMTILIPTQRNNAGLLERLLTNKTDLDGLHVNYYLMASEHASHAKDYEEACDICEGGLELYPQNVLLRNTLATALYQLGEQVEALEILKETLAIPDLAPLQRAMTLNNYSWFMLVAGKDPGNAYDYAQQAFNIAPWVPSFEGTFGAALIETGKVEQGIYHLLQTYEHHPIPSNRATNLAYAAIGYHRLGDPKQAKQRLEQALALDRGAEVVQKAQQELGLL